MRIFEVFWKRAFIALFLFLCACKTHCPQWEIEKVSTCYPFYNSKRIFFAADSISCSLELELDKTVSGTRMYINTFTIALNPSDPIVVTIDGQCTSYLAYFLQGGQRILVPDDAREAVIEALLNEKIVSITVGRYSANILPNKFSELFEIMQSPL